VTELSAPIRFGTDGWRAIIAQEFTFANVERVAQAYALYLQSHPTPKEQSLVSQLVEVGQISEREARDPLFTEVISKSIGDKSRLVVVGYDRRFLSEKFARRAAEVLAGNAFRVALFAQDTPTPLVSWAVKDLSAAGGIVITASHNPPDFNGFKIKAPWGGSATPETTAAVEKLLDVSEPKRSEIPSDGAELLAPAVANYRQQIASYIDLERLQAAPVGVIVDSMHGTGGRWVESFLSGSSLQVETIRADRDPLFGGVNPEPIDQNLAALRARVAEAGALVGLATDGDADRVGAVNERGETMTMHDVVPLILLHLARNRKMSGGVVRTFSQSILTKRIAKALGLRLYETPIGFKYVADLMLKDDILIGAEESGGIGVKGHIPERDGILNSLLFLEAVITADKPPSEMLRDLHREFGEFHFGRRDLRVEVEQGKQLVAELASAPPAKLGGEEVVNVATLDGTKLEFADESWLLFRQSGTEPALRVYAEATSVRKMNDLLEAGTRIANRPS
jgi:phosphomannomutase